ncbi:hypothetical protein GCM10019016_060550 [Streptomyces prasinosporus]|uniref:FAD/NAD(P)-binding domain-containing protein n=1 Tax=Streptomyces prasinosporus TaxID=68256 RepID=A0ABP6TUE0_9ACTN
MEEAIGLRNHVLEQMDIASSTRDPAVRDAALTFVFVGGGYAGTEALGELEDMARYATRYYHNVRPEDMKWILVEASDRILPEVGEEMGRYTVTELRRRNIDVRLETRLESCADRVAVLSDGSRFPDADGRVDRRSETAPRAGRHRPAAERARAAALHRRTGRPGRPPRLGRRGRGRRTPTSPRARRAASAPPTRSTPCARPGFLVTTSSTPCAANPWRRTPTSTPGSVASLGLHKGVAQIYGRKLKGYPRLVHAPHLPPQPGARPSTGRRAWPPNGPSRALQTGDRLPGITRTPAGGVRTGGRWKAFPRSTAQPEGVVLTGPRNSARRTGV